MIMLTATSLVNGPRGEREGGVGGEMIFLEIACWYAFLGTCTSILLRIWYTLCYASGLEHHTHGFSYYLKVR